MKRQGWYGERYKHGLASRGITLKDVDKASKYYYNKLKETMDFPDEIWILRYYSGSPDGSRGEWIETEFFLTKEEAVEHRNYLINDKSLPEYIRENMGNLILLEERYTKDLFPSELSMVKDMIDKKNGKVKNKEYDDYDDEEEYSPEDYYYDQCASQHLDISNRNRG